MNHLGDEIVAPTPNRDLRVAADDRFDSRDGSKALRSGEVVGCKYDGSLRAVPVNQALRPVDVDDASVLDDCYPVAQPFGLFHKMSGQENCLAALADIAHQVPDGAPRLRVQSGGQLVEKYHLRIVDQRKRNEQSLLLPAREGHEPCTPLVDQAKLFEQPFTVCRFLPIKGRPEVYRLPHFDPLLQLRLLELNSDPLLQLVNVVKGTKTQHRDGAPIGDTQPLDALHSCGLSRAVGSD